MRRKKKRDPKPEEPTSVQLGLTYRCPACRSDEWERLEQWNTYLCISCGTYARMSVEMMEIVPCSGGMDGLDDERVTYEGRS